MDKRILLITGTTEIFRKPNETDNKMEEVFNITLDSKITYAKKHGYDILCLRSFGKDVNNIFEETDVAHLRILRPIEMLKWYDIVMWIDADSLITNNNIKIEDFELDPNVIFYSSWDWNGKYSLSTGNFIVQKTDNLDVFYQYMVNISKHCTSEQQTINTMFRLNETKSYIKVLDHKYLNSVPIQQQDLPVWKDRLKIYSPWNNTCFLAHLTGIPNADRIKILNNYFEDYI